MQSQCYKTLKHLHRNRVCLFQASVRIGIDRRNRGKQRSLSLALHTNISLGWRKRRGNTHSQSSADVKEV